MKKQIRKANVIFKVVFWFVALVFALQSTNVYAADLDVKPLFGGNPQQKTPWAAIYPGGNGVKEVEITVPVNDRDRESVGGDLKIVVDGKEHIHKEAYTKLPTNNFIGTVIVKMPSENLVPGKNQATLTIISRNTDESKTAESPERVLVITKYQRYSVNYLDKRTSTAITVPESTHFPTEIISFVGAIQNNKIIGRTTVDGPSPDMKYSFDQALVGTEPIARANMNTNLNFNFKLGSEAAGNEINVLYESDTPEFYSKRQQELTDERNKQATNPMITRDITKGDLHSFKQRVLFGPVNGLKAASEPFPELDVLGNGSGANSGNLYLNILNQYTSSDYAMSVADANVSDSKISGLSIFRGGPKSNNTPLYLDPQKTEYYVSETADGDDMITVLSLVKPSWSNTSHKERLVVEYTAVINQKTNDIDVTVEVTNGSGEEIDISLMYQSPLQIMGEINGTTHNTPQPVKALGDNKGVYVEVPGMAPATSIQAAIKFPAVADNGPESWIVSARAIDSYRGFDRGPLPNTLDGKGFELGYTQAESNAAGNSSWMDQPYKQGHTVYSADDYAVRFKSPAKKTKPNESVKMSWSMSFGEEKYKKPENSIYREMDKKSGETLDGYDFVDRLVPIEIDTTKIDDVTQVKNYLVFGGQNQLDTMSSINKGQNHADSGLFAPYLTQAVPFSFPRVISYRKGFMDSRPSSYSYYYDGNANEAIFGGSGFGLATFDAGSRTQNPVPDNLTKSTQVEEAYISKDAKTLKVYGKYTFGIGPTGRAESIPMKITAESSDDKGKARFSVEFMNTMNYQTNFRAFYSVHMDINGIHRGTAMKSLGGKKGIYFEEPKLATMNGADYFVAFYTGSSNNGTGPDDMNVYSLDSHVGGTLANTNSTIPLGWTKRGRNELTHLNNFNPIQAKGETFKNREIGTGRVLPAAPAHPGWQFVFPKTELAVGEVGRSEMEMKVTDIPEIAYAPVSIVPEKDKAPLTKFDFTYNPQLVQDMSVIIKTPAYRPDKVQIEGTYMPYLDDVTETDFKVLKKDGTELDADLYEFELDKPTRTVKVLFTEPAPTDLIKETVVIQQNSKISTDKDNAGIIEYYDKAKGQFAFPITAFNSWEIYDDPEEPRETQEPKSEGIQVVKYQPNFDARPAEDKTVSIGDAAGNPEDYLKSVAPPIFEFDEYEVSFKNNRAPEFKADGNQIVEIVVTSKAFGNSVVVPVKVKVESRVDMTIKHVLINKDKTESKLKDLTKNDLPDLGDVVKKVSSTSDFQKILTELKEDKITGYDYDKATMTYNGSTVDATTVPKVPKDNFTVTMYYRGKVFLDSPESFDFGKHKLVDYGVTDIRPKITKDGNDADEQVKMRVVNTQGKGGIWDLYAMETKRLAIPKTGGSSTEYKGEIFYIPTVNAKPIVFSHSPQKIQTDTGQAEAIMNVVPFLPRDLKTRSGIYMTILPGNKHGVYKDGEITWELRDAR